MAQVLPNPLLLIGLQFPFIVSHEKIDSMTKRLVTVSKFLSKYLRHEPEVLGLTLEPGGWVLVDDLLAGADKQGFPITKEELFQVVAENDKRRFSLNEAGTKIRANQGHSTEVDLQLKEAEPPTQLFHGTVSRFLDAILTEGLKKMDRHDVHLSKDLQTALKVGGRRGRPVVLAIDSAKMAADWLQVSAIREWRLDDGPCAATIYSGGRKNMFAVAAS